VTSNQDEVPDGAVPEGVDVERPSAARLYDYLLGGRHNFAADRDMARRVIGAEPNARLIVQENRAFLRRAVRYLVAEGVRQFLDLGSGIPTQDNVHEIAQRLAPGSRVVYVDHDPVAVAHSAQILADNPDAGAVLEDLRRPEAVLAHPTVGSLLDFSRPVGLLMVAVLHFVPDEDEPLSTVVRYREALAPGSHLVLSHGTYEAAPQNSAEVERLYSATSSSAHVRSLEDITRFFTGFDLAEPGIVYVPEWRPERSEPLENPERAWFYAGVGRLVSLP
jgi:SAM-dependent methyltransferase